MDFFESQAQAQRRTKLLVVLFIAAVVSIVLLTNLLFLLVVNYSTTEGVATGGFLRKEIERKPS